MGARLTPFHEIQHFSSLFAGEDMPRHAARGATFASSEMARTPFPFDTVLIANRGEIALRVIRACRDLGLRSVAVYSDADRTAAHVRMADEAIHIGPAPAAESYLSIPRILDAARQSGAGAIHPGYGFLSENPEFADACEAAGLRFVGPPGRVMREMGEKTAARRVARGAGVPIVPGYDTGLDDIHEAKRLADDIGYPIMIKAAAARASASFTGPKTWRPRSGWRAARRRARSAIAASIWRRRSYRRAISRCRSLATPTATSSTWASGNARSSAATRS
jgi:pyruvate carboxylase